MARRKRFNQGNHVYHVLNRSAKRVKLFANSADYQDFQTILAESKARTTIRILAYCLMPNHWHLLLWPRNDGDMSRFTHLVTTTHARRWNWKQERVGDGAVYQSRFKSIPVQNGSHLYWVWRYIERNALRANLVERAEQWKWCSLAERLQGHSTWLDEGPTALPFNWTELVNLPQTAAELDRFHQRMSVGKPFGDDDFLRRTEVRRGRPFTKNVKMGSDPN